MPDDGAQKGRRRGAVGRVPEAGEEPEKTGGRKNSVAAAAAQAGEAERAEARESGEG